jgi:hypothetical protein
MATDTAPNQTDTPAKPAAAAKPAKTAAKPRSRTASKSRTRTSAKSRARKPAARASRPQANAAPRAQATTPNGGGRQVFAGVLDAQEKTLTALADYQTRAAELSPIPGAAAIAGAQAQLLRGATDAYLNAARSLLK